MKKSDYKSKRVKERQLERLKAEMLRVETPREIDNPEICFGDIILAFEKPRGEKKYKCRVTYNAKVVATYENITPEGLDEDIMKNYSHLLKG